MDTVQLENVTKIYTIGQDETRAVDGVTLSLEGGELAALVGPSGSGKTTILQLMGCLDMPDSGTITIDGQDVTRLSANERAEVRLEKIGFIFQFFALVPVLSAYENVELPLLLNGVGARERQERVMELLKAVGLDGRIKHRPDQMSGGEQQRVAIARALAIDPVLVLADEPTANLDSENGRQIMEIMQRLNEETGTTFIFASHDPRTFPFARRVVEIRDGKVAENSKHAEQPVRESSE